MNDIILLIAIIILALPVTLVVTFAVGFGVTALTERKSDEECQR